MSPREIGKDDETGSHVQLLCKVLATCTEFKVDLNDLGPQIGLSTGKNVPRKINSVVNKYGYEWKAGRIVEQDPEIPVTPISASKSSVLNADGNGSGSGKTDTNTPKKTRTTAAATPTDSTGLDANGGGPKATTPGRARAKQQKLSPNKKRKADEVVTDSEVAGQDRDYAKIKDEEGLQHGTDHDVSTGDACPVEVDGDDCDARDGIESNSAANENEEMGDDRDGDRVVDTKVED